MADTNPGPPYSLIGNADRPRPPAPKSARYASAAIPVQDPPAKKKKAKAKVEEPAPVEDDTGEGGDG